MLRLRRAMRLAAARSAPVSGGRAGAGWQPKSGIIGDVGVKG